MTELAHTIDADEAEGIREIAAGGDPTVATVEADEHRRRIWSPIELVDAPTGRARCRLCSGAIAKGERVIKFGFDPYGEGSWGKLSAAYLHVNPCPGQEAR